MSAPDGPPVEAGLELHVVAGRDEGRVLDVTAPAILGRDSSRADLVLQDPETSRRHASLVPTGHSLAIEDLESTNGTYVNGERIARRRVVVPGDSVRIGSTTLEVRLAAGAAAEVEPEGYEADAEAAEPEQYAAEPEPEQYEPEHYEPDHAAGAAEPEAGELDAEPYAAEAEPYEAEAEPYETEAEPYEAEGAAEAPAGGSESAAVAARPAADQPDSAPILGPEAEVAKAVHARVRDNFFAILRGWSNRDADALKPHVSRAFLDRATDAAEELDQSYQINGISDVELRDVAVQRRRDAGRDQPICAYVSFVARDWIEDLRSGEILDGNASSPLSFTECWIFSFERRRGWVVDHVEPVWTGPADAANTWQGLPPGWYARQDRPSTWNRWDGEAWAGSRAARTRA